jgi:uncharacterized membrane protein (UPF0127 family)
LSGTKALPADQAMLFVFDHAARWGIWMKDMHYNLDILWLDDNKNVVYIAENISPDTYPTVFLPDKDARYVVELPANSISHLHVHMGQTVNFVLP